MSKRCYFMGMIGFFMLAASCQPRVSEVSVLPTLAVLPSVTLSYTPENTAVPTYTPTPEFTSTSTATATPSATITETPTLTTTYTSTPSITPSQTLVPTVACNAREWDDQVSAWFIGAILFDAASYQSLYNQVAALPYTPCIELSRSYFLSYLNENILFFGALDRNDFEATDLHLAQIDMYFIYYLEESLRAYSQDTSQTFNPTPRPLSGSSGSSSGSSFSCPSNCTEARARGVSAGMAAACGLDRDHDGVACYGD